MPRISLPADLDSILDEAWKAAGQVPGFLTETEARFLGMAAACSPAHGAILEIGSFKGKSTVMLGCIARHYGLGPVVAVDPHNFSNSELHEYRQDPGATSWEAFRANIHAAGVETHVEAYRQYSTELAGSWNRPIRLLWIDGDHSWKGAKVDFDGFAQHLEPGGIVAFHDALHPFEGPIRVFVEQILRSDRFGAAGFAGSIAWAQFRPQDGSRYKKSRENINKIASNLISYVSSDSPLRGIKKLGYKFNRSRIPRALPSLEKFVASLSS